MDFGSVSVIFIERHNDIHVTRAGAKAVSRNIERNIKDMRKDYFIDNVRA